MTLRVEGKVIVVTGAAAGQGAAEVAALISEGAVVYGVDVVEPVDPCFGVHYRHLDVSSPDDWMSLSDELRREHGRAHGLVNNAATGGRQRILEVDIGEWERIFRINVTGPLLGLQSLVPLMTDGGSVANICSLAALTGHYPAAYTSSKWGLRGLTRTASMELGERGVRVNAIFPGYVETAMVASAPPEFREMSIAQIPLGRTGLPADIAPAIVYLMSDESSWVTGAEISIDGGEWAHGGMLPLRPPYPRT